MGGVWAVALLLAAPTGALLTPGVVPCARCPAPVASIRHSGLEERYEKRWRRAMVKRSVLAKVQYAVGALTTRIRNSPARWRARLDRVWADEPLVPRAPPAREPPVDATTPDTAPAPVAAPAPLRRPATPSPVPTTSANPASVAAMRRPPVPAPTPSSSSPGQPMRPQPRSAPAPRAPPQPQPRPSTTWRRNADPFAFRPPTEALWAEDMLGRAPPKKAKAPAPSPRTRTMADAYRQASEQ